MAIATVLLSAAIPALQAEEGPGLPGVDRKVADQARIRPLGEPVADTPQADANGFVRIGDWDVKISGSVTIDIGTFAPRTGR
ncbi:hypothetical protein [Allomesorhizobium camelthorni]|uniref:hypothetical protein n=1 Tax=Allomesorhizobium camelthorni TaxID=475069 RepID=UPI00197E7E42|nr:hypothetical protein [Mesorhizobium camelthorni]